MVQRLFQWRFILFVAAIGIVTGTVVYTRYLAGKIAREERQRVQEWVQAATTLPLTNEAASINLANLIMVNNEDMPMIITDEDDNILDYHNIDSIAIRGNKSYLTRKLAELRNQNPPLSLRIGHTPVIEARLYYGHTRLLTEVQFYPFVQLLVVAIFLILVLSLISIQHKSTQNQVWAGMAKETAHQMGTPLTSLQGWVELLRDNPENGPIVEDMEKDVARLRLVSDRFSKIGSTPQLELTALAPLLNEMVSYMRRRAPEKVHFEVKLPTQEVITMLSPTLFNWVLENLLKNALDAMDGSGRITVSLEAPADKIIVDVTDTGKGIATANIANVFKPGFTTKKRGWGLGLTLSKRIITQYHKGELVVRSSEPGKGTTFRIVLNHKAQHT